MYGVCLDVKIFWFVARATRECSNVGDSSSSLAEPYMIQCLESLSIVDTIVSDDIFIAATFSREVSAPGNQEIAAITFIKEIRCSLLS